MEISKRVEKFIKENTRDSYYYDGCEVIYKNGYIGIIDLCEEYIKAMKDEEAR